MELPKRKPNRLEYYDYSREGYYFITICTREMKNLFWKSNVGADIIRPPLSRYGKIVDTAINAIPEHYPNMKIDKYVIMPNHIHFILVVSSDENNGRMISAPTRTISTVIGQMKCWVSKEAGVVLWQKSYHDHVIRGKKDYQKIWAYIDTNPLKWELDRFYRRAENEDG